MRTRIFLFSALALLCSFQVVNPPQTYTYDLIIVSGQSNAGQNCFGATLTNTLTWDTNKFKNSPTMACANNYGLKMGFLYYLSQKLKAKYPTRKFIFLDLHVRATSIMDTQVAGWNPTTPYNLFYHLANNIRDCIDRNGQPSSVQFMWVQGEQDYNKSWKTYLSKETQLYDSLPKFTGASSSKWKFFSYLPKSQSDLTYCDSINYAKKQHALLDTARIKTFEVDRANYVLNDIHMIQTSGLVVCADTLMKKIKF